MDILASILQVQNTLKIGDNTDYTNVFTDSNGWLNFSPTGSHTICNGRLGGSDVLLQWAAAGYGGGIGVSAGDYQGPRTLMEMFYSLSSAPNVPDVFRYKTIIDAQKYDGAWLTDALDWTGLLTPNNSTTTAITYAENQAGFTAKRFTVDIGASWNRSNLIALQSAFSGGTPTFVLKVERSVNNSTWTTIFDSTVSSGLAYVFQNDAGENRYFRFTVTLVSSLGVGVALAFSKLIGFNARLYGGSSLQPFVTDYSRNTTFNGHLLLASGKQIQAQDGSASAASLSFASETNTGFYRAGTGILGVTTAGVQRARFLSTGLEVFNTTGPQIRLSGQAAYGGGMYLACVDEGDPTNEGYLGFGAEGTHSGSAVATWVARQGAAAAGSAGILHCDNGTFTFYSNTTGLTAGSTFTPTSAFVISSSSISTSIPATFANNLTTNGALTISSTDSRLVFTETDAPLNWKRHDFINQNGYLYGRFYSDDGLSSHTWLTVSRNTNLQTANEANLLCNLRIDTGYEVLNSDGTGALPSYSFWGETNTGMYRVSAGLLGFTTLGTQRASLSSSAFTLASGVALSVASSASLNSLAVTTTVTIGSTLAVTGATTMSDNLTVTGQVTATGSSSGFIIRRRDTSANAWQWYSGTNGALQLYDHVLGADRLLVTQSTGHFAFAGPIGVSGAATLSSTLGVTGATTLSSTLGVSGATTLSSTLAVTGATTLSSTLAVTGIATFSNEVVDWSSYSAIHFGTVDTFWEATQRLQAQADTSSTTCMELEVMTPAATYGGVARITRWQINTRGAIYVSRYEENGGAGNCTLRILSDNSKANVTTVRDRFVVGITFSDTYQMAYMRVRYTNGTNGRWSTLIAKATSTPTTVSGSSMTYSSGWIANTGYTVEAFTENIVNGKFGTLNLTGTLTGVAATLSGTATLSGDLAVRSTALVVGSRGTSVTTSLSLSPSTNSNEGGFKVVTNMTDTAAYHKIGIWNEYYLSGSGHSATQRTAIWNTVSASSADTFASIAGQYMYLNVGNASGVVTSYSAFIISAPQGSGTVTSHIGLNLADIASGSVGAAYGIYSAMGTTGGTRYFIYQAGAAPSYFRGQILGYASDSSSAPSYSWLGDLTTGLYRISAGNIGLSGSFSVSSNLAIGSTAAPGFPLDIRASWSGYRQSVRIFNTQTAATGNGSDILFDSNRTTGGATTTAAIRSGIHDIDNTNYKGHLIFMTADGAYPTERLRINHKGHLIFPELTTDPTTTDLTAAGSYNENNLAIYCKNNKLVIAYNDGNSVIRYITIPLNGTTTTWTHSDATP